MKDLLTNHELHLDAVLLAIEWSVKPDDDDEFIIPAHNEAGVLVLAGVVRVLVVHRTHINTQHRESLCCCEKDKQLT